MSRYTGSPMISIAPFVALLDLERNCRHCCLDLLEMSGDPHPRRTAGAGFIPMLCIRFSAAAQR
jgi:hypothetical protein